MTQPSVYACIDGSRAMLGVCDYAAWAAGRLSAPLTLLHALDHGPAIAETDLSGNIGLGSREYLLQELADLDEKRARLMREQGDLLLEKAGKRVTAAGTPHSQSLQHHGRLPETLHELSADIRLLVMGRQGLASDDNLGAHVGSQLESVIRTISRPTLVVTGEFEPPTSVLLAFDDGPSTRKCVELLATSPLVRGLPIHLLMVGSGTPKEQAAITAAQEHLQQTGLEVVAEVRAGDVEDTLLDYAQEHDIGLLVMGAYGHSRIRQFFVGSTTTKMLGRSTRPLLLLR